MIALILAQLTPEQGSWLITGLGSLGFLVGIAVGIKKLFWKESGIAQPLIVALEKEFVLKRDHDNRDAELHRRITNIDAYAHQESHNLREVINSMGLSMQVRNERLSALEADSKTHTHQLRDLNVKVDGIVKNVGDKVEQLIRDGVIRGGRS